MFFEIFEGVMFDSLFDYLKFVIEVRFLMKDCFDGLILSGEVLGLVVMVVL